MFVEASALRNPRGARVYVEVSLEGEEGQEYELGTFTFFGATPDADKRVFAFPLEAEEREALVSEGAQVRASMKPLDANDGDISDVRVDLRAWVEVR